MQKYLFGKESVLPNQKTTLVQDLFSRVSSNYDRMNDCMSFGLHRIWKKRLIREINPFHLDFPILDMAGGTGDISISLLKKGYINLTVADLNEEMMIVGQDRIINEGYSSNSIIWKCENAEKLTLDSEHFHYYIIAFGIRNVTHIKDSLYEAYRVLRPTGKFICMEFNNAIDNKILNFLYQHYSDYIIPMLGHYIANDMEAYNYLVESIRQFYSVADFIALMESVGFRQIKNYQLGGGIVSLYVGYK